jgi:hypothetical protein
MEGAFIVAVVRREERRDVVGMSNVVDATRCSSFTALP